MLWIKQYSIEVFFASLFCKYKTDSALNCERSGNVISFIVTSFCVYVHDKCSMECLDYWWKCDYFFFSS